jgi:hypothetical protein
MRRRLPRLLLTLAALTAPPSSARADHPTPYKGRFDFTTVDVQPVSATVLLVRGNLAGNETHLGRFTGEVEYLVDSTGMTRKDSSCVLRSIATRISCFCHGASPFVPRNTTQVLLSRRASARTG